MRKVVFLTLCIICTFLTKAQIGGNNVYEFLNLNSSARVSSLGGNQIAVRDDDPFLAAENPALYNESMNNKLAFSYQSYLADIGNGYFSYTKHLDSIGTFNLGVKYLSYGDFEETDVAGNITGDFSAGEYAFIASYARPLDSNYNVGASIKTIYSSLYDYNSLGIAADLGINYFKKKSGLSYSLLFKNVGSQITTYTDDETEAIPFEIQLGIAKRLKNVPLRVSLIAHNLQEWDLTYDKPEFEKQESLFGDQTDSDRGENGFFDNVARHLIFNAEFLISKNFNVRFGYNYFRRKELRVDEKLGTVGVSWGFGMRISKFHLSYGRAAYHIAGATNTFSVSTKLSDFFN